MRMPTSQKWFTDGSSRKLPRTNKNLIIETRNDTVKCTEHNNIFPLQARRKSEELKTELSDSSKRNSIAADSGSKRSSLFSPENSDGGESSPRKLSMKSSAQAVRFLNKGRNMVSICQEFKGALSQ